MKEFVEFLQSLFKTSEDRVKHPFIGAFMTSWVIFNWKAIFYMVLSDIEISAKIEYVSQNFSDNEFLLYWPFGATLVYVFALPHFDLFIDWVMAYSSEKKTKNLLKKQKLRFEYEIETEKSKIDLEESKTQHRERRSHNEMVENLQSLNAKLSTLLDDAKQKLIQAENEKRGEIESLESRYTNEINLLKTELKNASENSSVTRMDLHDIEMKYRKSKEQLENLKLQMQEESDRGLKKMSRPLAASYEAKDVEDFNSDGTIRH